MPKNFITDFVKVATSGKTIDEREIKPEWLTQIAETYDTDEYTANIFYEHIRMFGNFGRVVEVKTDTDDKGRVCLFARIAPNTSLIELNDNGQKLYTSIEVVPNFAGTGKAYLGGLAVTDNPASLGTEALHFSYRKQAADNFFTAPEVLEFSSQPKKPSLPERIKQYFTKQEDDMSPEQFDALAKSLETMAGGIATLNENFNQRFPAQAPAAPKAEPASPGEGSTAFSREEFDGLANSVTTLTQSLEKLQTDFTSALNEAGEGTTVPDDNGQSTNLVV